MGGPEAWSALLGQRAEVRGVGIGMGSQGQAAPTEPAGAAASAAALPVSHGGTGKSPQARAPMHATLPVAAAPHPLHPGLVRVTLLAPAGSRVRALDRNWSASPSSGPSSGPGSDLVRATLLAPAGSRVNGFGP